MFYEVILDAHETANKCTIVPLAYRTDFRLIQTRGGGKLGPLQSTLLLHHEGKCLTEIQQELGDRCPGDLGVATIDCVWQKLEKLFGRIAGQVPLLARIPDGFETAYPRRSSKDTDPAGGLATIEAIFTAAAILGNWDTTLLSEYYFGQKFIDINAHRFADLGIGVPPTNAAAPIFRSRPRTSRQRRQDRGKLS